VDVAPGTVDAADLPIVEGARGISVLEDAHAMNATHILEAPVEGDDWLGLSSAPLPADVASVWAQLPHCGGTVTFVGSARDHSEGRPGVELLEYEAYEDQVVPRLQRIAAEARARWPSIGRIAMLHRVGALEVGEPAVVVVVSAPHRDEAFLGARFCIDDLKASVPIWKKESWDGGSSWGLDAQHVTEPEATR
jgi:molybdopterin synthase catalytic subunit